MLQIYNRTTTVCLWNIDIKIHAIEMFEKCPSLSKVSSVKKSELPADKSLPLEENPILMIFINKTGAFLFLRYKSK